jgi:PDZ domain-containing secreted protein
MRKFLGMAVGTAIAVAVSAANAQTAEGTIEEIDPVMKTITVDGQVYTMPEETAAGTDVNDLEVGDRVNITYETDEGADEDATHRAMLVEKVEQ